MKRAKIMLSAIAMLAFIGGALALKVKSNNTLFFESPTNTGAGCVVSSVGFETTSDSGAPTAIFSTTSDAACAQIPANYTVGN